MQSPYNDIPRRYSINFRSLAENAVPPHLRQRKMLSLVRVLTAEVGRIWLQFKALWNYGYYAGSFTAQVIYLEHLLNDQLDYEQRRITIEDGEELTRSIVYQHSEPQRFYVRDYSESTNSYSYSYDVIDTKTDFIIKVPTVSTYYRNVVDELVNRYKAAGKTFKIEAL